MHTHLIINQQHTRGRNGRDTVDCVLRIFSAWIESDVPKWWFYLLEHQTRFTSGANERDTLPSFVSLKEKKIKCVILLFRCITHIRIFVVFTEEKKTEKKTCHALFDPPHILSLQKSRRCTYGGRPRDRSYPATDYPRQEGGVVLVLIPFSTLSYAPSYSTVAVLSFRCIPLLPFVRMGAGHRLWAREKEKHNRTTTSTRGGGDHGLSLLSDYTVPFCALFSLSYSFLCVHLHLGNLLFGNTINTWSGSHNPSPQPSRTASSPASSRNETAMNNKK